MAHPEGPIELCSTHTHDQFPHAGSSGKGSVTLITQPFCGPGDDSFHSWLFSRALPWLAGSLDRIVLDRGMACSCYPAYMSRCRALPPGSVECCLDRYISFATSLSGPLISIWGRVQFGVRFSIFLLFFFRFCRLLSFCCPNIFYLLSLFRSDASCLIFANAVC